MAQGVSDPALQLIVTSTPPLNSPPPGALGAQEASGVLWAELGLSFCRLLSLMGGALGAVFFVLWVLLCALHGLFLSVLTSWDVTWA